MDSEALLKSIFRDCCNVAQRSDLLTGTGSIAGETIAIIGTANHAAIGVELALAMAAEVLRVAREHPGRPILLLVDTQGQRLRRRDELLGINTYMAHLAKSLEVARRAGHRIVSLVYGHAVSGGYLAGGMMADACYALASAEISVMNLPAMARVTKIPQERLEELSRSSPVFAPGAENYLQMGALDGIWSGDIAESLRAALQEAAPADRRSARGSERGGRRMAAAVAERIRRDVID